MPRTWFEQLVVSTQKPRRSPVGVAFSIGTHAVLAAAVVVVPVLGRAQLPDAPSPRTVIDTWPTPATPPPVVTIVRTTPPVRTTRAAEPRSAAAPVAPVQRTTAVPTGEQDYVADNDASPVCLTDCDPAAPPSQLAGAAEIGIPDGGGQGAPVPIGGDIREPRRIHYVAPAYPELAQRAGIQGIVILECVLDEAGRVTDLHVLRGHALLDRAAIDAVKEWRYTPTLLNGVRVRVVMTVTVNFTLGRK